MLYFCVAIPKEMKMKNTPPYFCTWDVGTSVERKPCNKMTDADGKNYCADHRARLPFWPNDIQPAAQQVSR